MASEDVKIEELPDDLRVPLHSLEADIEYLFGRVAMDGSCAPAMANSVLERLHQIEDAWNRRAAQPVASAAPADRGAIAEAINKARYVPDGLPYQTLAQSDHHDNEYAYRLADGVLALFKSPPDPEAVTAGHAELVRRLDGVRQRHGRQIFDDDDREDREIISEAIAALQQEGPGAAVKPLVWDPYRAYTAIGQYRVEAVHGGGYLTCFGAEEIGAFGDLPKAKAAAQVDYEARINSALAHPLHQPAPEAGPVLPAKMFISGTAISNLVFQCGSNEDNTEFVDAVAWVGEIEADDGSKVHGLHAYSTEYPEDGSITLAEFAAPAPEPQAPAPASIIEAVRAYVSAAFEVGTSHGANPVDPDGELLGAMIDALTTAPDQAPVPDEVTDEMVDRALDAYHGPDRSYGIGELKAERSRMRAALAAANERSR